MSSIIAFPHTLGEEVTKGGNHVSFEIIGKEFDSDVFKIHLFIPSGISLGDGANFGNIDLGTINAVQGSLGKDAQGNKKSATDLEATAIGSALMQKMGIGDDLSLAAASTVKAGVALNNQSTLTSCFKIQ